MQLKKTIQVIMLMLVGLSTVGYTQGQSFEEWRRQQMQQYQQFVSERDRQFADFLRKEWITVELKSEDTPIDNKLPEIPVFVPPPATAPAVVPAPVVTLPPPVVTPPATVTIPPPVPAETRPSAPEPVTTPSVPTHAVRSFGRSYSTPQAAHFSQSLSGELNNNSIADYWLHLSGGPFQPVVMHIDRLRRENNWGDWATARFVRQYAEQTHRDENSRVALTWFLLSKLGYTAHVGYFGSSMYIIIPTTTNIYNVPRYTLTGTPMAFYLMGGINPETRGVTRINTYRSDDVPREKALELHFYTKPSGVADVRSRDVRFILGRDYHTVKLEYDLNHVQFMQTFPETDLSVFFSAPASQTFRNSLEREFGPLLAGKSLSESLNILLRFAQTGFEYKTDTDQFNRERFMTPDEILYYPYSDCDDRAILFAYLVRTLLDVPVIGLEYPRHVATAVLVPASLTGDRVMFDNKNWLVCDPTYIMADYGLTMPNLVGVNPTPIIIHQN
jgi:hypothetical protein